MNRREASKKETRKLILKAARRLFRKKGVEQCTMRAVAKEAGVSAATVILHFRSKISLLEVAITEDIDQALRDARATMPEKAGLLDRLMHIPGAMFSFYDTDRELYRSLIRNTVFEPEQDNPRITEQLHEYLSYLVQMIEQEKKAGTVLKEIDPDIAVSCIGALYIGVLIRFFRNPEITPRMAAEMLRGMKAQYLRGILTRKG
ncbi:MAG: TetR/AcrR family transcriptional regulator [Nitrospirota bacterium]